jgi:hypothetical protein
MVQVATGGLLVVDTEFPNKSSQGSDSAWVPQFAGTVGRIGIAGTPENLIHVGFLTLP